MTPKLAVVLGLALLVVVGFAFHWWILDVRRIWDWLVYAEPADLPGQPQSMPAPLAGEHHPDADTWDHLPPDEAAAVLIAEWHDEELPVVRPEDSPWNDPPIYRLERDWRDDPDLIVWDAKRQAARCWEILHVEFPRLRAELAAA